MINLVPPDSIVTVEFGPFCRLGGGISRAADPGVHPEELCVGTGHLRVLRGSVGEE